MVIGIGGASPVLRDRLSKEKCNRYATGADSKYGVRPTKPASRR
jgi:hypothetical protein